MEYNKETHYKTNNTQFKLVCWYSHKKNGYPYATSELLAGNNRKPIDSKDYSYTNEGRTITNHRRALKELFEHVDRYKHHIINAELYLNNFREDTQQVIGKYSNGKWNELIPCTFVNKEFHVTVNLGSDREQTLISINVFFKELAAPAIHTVPLDQWIVERKVKKEAYYPKQNRQ